MLTISRDVTLTDVETGLVILDGRRGRYWQLNSPGATALRMMLGGSSPQKAAAELASGTAVSGEQALDDVLALVDALRKAKLVSA